MVWQQAGAASAADVPCYENTLSDGAEVALAAASSVSLLSQCSVVAAAAAYSL